MKRNKKILLTLGTLASVAAPVAAVVSCGTSVDNGDVSGKSTYAGGPFEYNYKVLPTYTGQADQLLSLGIKPDRYPFQLDKTAPFGYITNPAKYMIGQDSDFTRKFSEKLASLMPEDRGTSWWNQAALNDGEKGSDPEYWQHRYGSFTMYEHYLLDDGAKKVGESTAVKHVEGSHTFAQTNFRESRDPFTRLPKIIMEALLDQSSYDPASDEVKAIVDEMLDVARDVEGYRTTTGSITTDSSKADTSLKAVDGGLLPSGEAQKSLEDDNPNSWIYNDYFFAKSYHEQFLDNAEFSGSAAHAWIINEGDDATAKENVFDKDDNKDAQLAHLFFESTYQASESKLKAFAEAQYTLQNPKFVAGNPAAAKPAAPKTSPHHPIYEQQESIGSAPMFEGAQRDNMLYFYNTAAKIQAAFTDPSVKPAGAPTGWTAPAADSTEAKSYNALKAAFNIGSKDEDPRVAQFQQATAHANTISTQLRARMANIANLVSAVKAKNNNNLTFGLVTLAPGEGQTTLQTSSKYSFLYNELGFDQATPSNLDEITKSPEAVKAHIPATEDQGAFFNMDDNGWWWNLGTGTKITTNAGFFNKTLDMGLLTANDTQYDNLKSNEKMAIAKMFKDEKNPDKVDYNLWNEGLKTPFVMNMMLDKITDMLINKAEDVNATLTTTQKTNAKAWGSYWTTDFVAGTK